MIFRQRFWLFVSLFFIVSSLFAEVAAPIALKVACVGDSITEGYQMPEKERNAYPAQLAALLGTGWEVRNFGVSGACVTEVGGYPYHKRDRAAAALAWKPDVAVIALGTNDTKAENFGTHPESFVPSYRRLLERLRAANPQVRLYLCLPPPLYGDAMGLKQAVLENSILPALRTIAAEEKLPLIDLHKELAGDAAHFPDLVHPDAEASAKIARVVYGEVMAREAGLAKALQPEVNTAVAPVSRLEFDSYNWWRRHADQLHWARKANPEIVLIGDSITHFWGGNPRAHIQNGPQAWERTFGKREVVNLGFGWDRTQNVLWRLDHGELDGLHPRWVVVTIGTNNLTGTEYARASTPEEVVQGILAVCERVRGKAPEANLLVMGVLPRGHHANDWIRRPIAEVNALLARTLAGRERITFLDIGSRFLDAQGEMAPALMPDGTHPSEAGYEIWGQALREVGVGER